MPLSFYNTLTRKKEIFEPADGKTALLYHCGPTVYHYAHIGNLRAYVFADILRRSIEREGFQVKQVINITDVGHLSSDADTGEDKLEKGAKREGKTAKEIADFYTRAFLTDLSRLQTEPATFYPRATESIPEQITLVEILEKKGYTYKTSDGIYFDTSKFPDYGRLAKLDLSGQKEGARIGINEEKKQPQDFALWKFSKEKRQQEWDSPWGIGFPGWHLECSAMILKYLGETIDIHTGGIDHIPVHHTNERAESISATGKPLARFWMHSGFVNVADEKMAKSDENFIRLETIMEKGYSPLSYRYFLLTAHYRTTINFSFEALDAASKALLRIYEFLANEIEAGIPSEFYLDKFMEKLEDDLNTPEALAVMWELFKDPELNDGVKKATLLSFDEVLGLDFMNPKNYVPENLIFENIPLEVQILMRSREIAREEKNFQEADKLRLEIEKYGYTIKDTENGPEITKK